MAYLATAYRACGVTVHVGRRANHLLRLIGAREACFLGADNPRSRKMSPGWNRRARRRLATNLRRVPTWPATGTWRGWSEAHTLAALPAARARVLARRFRQNAIVILRQGAPAKLLWTRLRMTTRQSECRVTVDLWRDGAVAPPPEPPGQLEVWSG